MERWIKMLKRFNLVVGIIVLLAAISVPLLLVESAAAAPGEEDLASAAPTQMSRGLASGETVHPLEEAHLTAEGHAKIRCWAFLAAAIATGIGSLAAGYAVGQVGTAAMGAVAEKPELMGKSLIYVALAEGIAIYGLLIAIIVLAKV